MGLNALMINENFNLNDDNGAVVVGGGVVHSNSSSSFNSTQFTHTQL